MVQELNDLALICRPFADRNRALVGVITRIRESLDLETILQTTVAEVRHILQVDRVAIVRLPEGRSDRSEVVAESVVGDWASLQQPPAALQGVVQQWGYQLAQAAEPARIHVIPSPNPAAPQAASLHAGASPEQEWETLAQLQVRSAVHVPLLKSQNSWGWLVVHHCTHGQSHNLTWQSVDLEFLDQIAQHLSVAIQHNAYLEHLKKQRTQLAQILKQKRVAERQRTLANTIHKIRQSLDIDVIFQTTTQETRQLLQVDRVLVYQFETDWGGQFVAEAVSQGWTPVLMTPDCQSLPGLQVPPSCRGQLFQDHKAWCVDDLYDGISGGLRERVGKHRSPEERGGGGAIADRGLEDHHASDLLETVEPVVAPDPEAGVPGEDTAEWLQNQVLSSLIGAIEGRAAAIAPIFQMDRLWGILIACQHTLPRSWQRLDSDFLSQIAAQLGIALQQAELLERTRRQTAEITKAFQQLQQTQMHLIQSEKMASLGQLVAGIAHEINNPVNFIYGNLTYVNNYTLDLLELLKLYHRELPNPSPALQERLDEVELDFIMEDLPKTLVSMKSGADRIRELVNSLQTFSRLDRSAKHRIDLHEGLESTLAVLNHRLKPAFDRPPIRIIRDYHKLPSLDCYAAQLNQVFLNLINNGIDALEDAIDRGCFHDNDALTCPNPTLRLTTRYHLPSAEAQAQGQVPQIQISIADNGLGIAPTIQPYIFNPFYTTKAPGHGTGLGLSISYQIVVERHHGELICHSQPGHGTEFHIKLPVQTLETPDWSAPETLDFPDPSPVSPTSV